MDGDQNIKKYILHPNKNIFQIDFYLNLKTCFKSKHKHVKMMGARKYILKRPMLITKAINFHLKREQIPNCLPVEIY